MRALVTGSSGFLGRHFCAELEERGYYVDRYDVRDGAGGDCRRLFDSPLPHLEYDLTVHCAAVIGGRAKIDGDPLATAVNLELDAAYLRWAARVRPGQVVYVSSSAVYPVDLQTGRSVIGIGLERSIDADHRLVESEQNAARSRVGTPDQVYGWTKLVGERLCKPLTRAGVPVTIVRPFSGYGADQDLDYPFPSFVARGKQRRDPFVIWGDGRQTRDFIHVSDVVRGTLTAVVHDAARWLKNPSGYPLRPVNLCTGRPTSFDQLADIVCASAGYEPRCEHLATAPTGVRYRVGDPTYLNTFYHPRMTVEEGVWDALDAIEVTS